MAGLTPTGLEVKRLSDILEDLKTRARSPQFFGPSVAVDDDTPLGHLLALFAESLDQVWQLSQQVYDSRDPYGAEGTSLDNLCLLVGVEREPERKSTVTLTLSGTAGVVIPVGTVARVPTGPRFVVNAAATIGLLGTVDTTAEAEEAGPLEAPAGTVTERVTLIAGWTGVTNAADASVGRLVETDEELRLRREASLQVIGAGSDEAIRARVDALDEVDAAICISNRTDIVDGRGIPPHAFMVVVWPDPVSTPSAIAEAIWLVQPAGIASHGTEAFSVTDEQGYEQTVKFSYATQVAIWLSVTLSYSESYGGDAAVVDALLAHGATYSVGDPVRLLGFLLAATEVSGIVSCTVRGSRIGPPGPGDTLDIILDLVEIARFDAVRISVFSAPA